MLDKNHYFGQGHLQGVPIVQGAVGLLNLGNTCYMNSLLQCLSNTEALTRHFLSRGYRDDIVAKKAEAKASGKEEKREAKEQAAKDKLKEKLKAAKAKAKAKAREKAKKARATEKTKAKKVKKGNTPKARAHPPPIGRGKEVYVKWVLNGEEQML